MPPRPATHPAGEDTPTVPLTVWPLPALPAGSDTLLPQPAADRIVATYTRAGEQAATIDGPPTMATACARLDRAHTHLASQPAGAGYPPRFPQLPGHLDRGSLHLLVDAPAGRPPAPAAPAALLGWYTACAGLLAAGGHLLVVLDDRAEATGADTFAETVTTARAAGLAYLQHLVVLRLPIRGGQLDTTTLPAGPPGSDAGGGGLHRVHTDIVVFTRPGPPRGTTGTGAGGSRG